MASLNLSLKSADGSMATLKLAMNNADDSQAVIDLATHGFVADGQWHPIRIPLSAYAEAGADLGHRRAPGLRGRGRRARGQRAGGRGVLQLALSPPGPAWREANRAQAPDPDMVSSLALATGCGGPSTRPDLGRRTFAPSTGDAPTLDGIGYGPFRAGQRPSGRGPTAARSSADLRLLSPRWGMIRVYSSRGPTALILETIRALDLPLRVVVGAWIAPGEEAQNALEVAEAIRLARAYPDQVVAVSVGNETQVSWSAHRSSAEGLIGHLRTVRAAISQPVTTADDHGFWRTPESLPVAAEVDFLLLHAYAMWNQQPLEGAVGWTAETVEAISRVHPGLPIVLGEVGWATALNPEGDEVKYIKAPAGPAEQARFFSEFTAWARQARQPYFYFEAFDEPWKGSADPREVEKHWGLFHEDRTPKAALLGVSP
ncbi:MAG: hypothetical protein R3F60_19005 [bacterium]